jgi:serine/threonine protein kinase
MECLGPSLECVRESAAGSRLSLSTTLRVGIEAVRALREIHARGIVHRDVKPSNFVIRPSRRRPLAIIDFGLARPFADPETHEVREPRCHPGFVGTAYYASNNALRGRELGPRDDLVSLLYSLVEFRAGSLPWRYASNKRELILAVRNRVTPEKLFRKCPRQFGIIQRILNSYQVFEIPDYGLLISILAQAMEENQCSWADAYDWEMLPKRKMKELTSLVWVIPEDEAEPNEVGQSEFAMPDLEALEDVDVSEEGDLMAKESFFRRCLLLLCGC